MPPSEDRQVSLEAQEDMTVGDLIDALTAISGGDRDIAVRLFVPSGDNAISFEPIAVFMNPSDSEDEIDSVVVVGQFSQAWNMETHKNLDSGVLYFE